MKKILSAVFFVLMFAVVANADILWQTANQNTVRWDAVTLLSNGTPIPTGSSIEYVVYLANFTSDPTKTNPVEVGTTADTAYTVTLNIEGFFLVGVKTVRKLDTGVVVQESAIAWSDDPAYVSAEKGAFGIRYFLPPAAITNFRLN